MIGFRVDANETVATGHLMRCIAMAEACRKRGVRCMFYMAEEKEAERLRQRGFPYRVLGTAWNRMEEELPMLRRLLEEERPDWLVVDSYQATGTYLAGLRELVPVLYVDDMREQVYPVAAVLWYIPCENGGCIRQQYDRENTVCLEGFSYVPLREEFQRYHEIKREMSILITTGGTDTYNVAGKVLQYCCGRKEFAPYGFHVIVGSMNRNENKLMELAQTYTTIHLHKNISNIGEYMQKCEIAVSAGGTTLLELCACRTPAVCFTFADNQRGFAHAMERSGLLRYAGDARDDDAIAEQICKHLLFFIEDAEQKATYAARMGRLVDGKGAERIADFLLSRKR